MTRPLFRTALVLGLLTTVFAGQARAEARRKVAVLDVNAVGAFDAQTIAGLSTLVAFESSQFPVQVISGSDVRALISHDREKELLGCKDSSCLAEIGGALGADYILATEVSEVGGVWLVSMTLLDVARSQATKRVIRKTTRERQLVSVTSSATREVLADLAQGEPAVEGKAVRKRTSAPEEAVAGVDEGPRMRRRSKGLMITGIALVGTGVLGVAASAGSYKKGDKKAGGGFLALGVICAAAGAPLWLIFGKKVPVAEDGALVAPTAGASLGVGLSGVQLRVGF